MDESGGDLEGVVAFVRNSDHMLAAVGLVFSAGKKSLRDERRHMPGDGSFRQVQALGDGRLGNRNLIRPPEGHEDEKLGEGNRFFLGQNLFKALLHQKAHLVKGKHEALRKVIMERVHDHSIALWVRVSKLSMVPMSVCVGYVTNRELICQNLHQGGEE